MVVADPFRPADTRKAIARRVAELEPGAKVAVNMTGGTKLMFAGALSACWELGLEPFYVEVKNHNIIMLRDGSQVPFVGISDVEDFLRAGGFSTVSAGRWPQDPKHKKNLRLLEAEKIWAKRDALRGLYRAREFQDYLYRYDKGVRTQFLFAWPQGRLSVEKDGLGQLVLQGESMQGSFRFLAGGWLEEYLYSLLRPLESDGIIRDLRVGLEPGYQDDSKNMRDDRAQEFDCAFTDGKRLWIAECKAGQVKQEAIQKLENNLKLYGGVAARGILICSVPLTDANKKRLARLSSIVAVEPHELSTETLRRIISGVPGPLAEVGRPQPGVGAPDVG